MLRVFLFSAVFAVAWPCLGQGGLQPVQLQCEYLYEPVAIDTPQPRLSWRFSATQPDQMQSAYQILVADHAESLVQDQGTLWDSGKIASDQSHLVVYAGAPLQSNQRCYWKVRVWDAKDQASEWSSVARWTMGLLQPSDWRASWIGAAKPQAPEQSFTDIVSFENSRWIWTQDAERFGKLSKGDRWFRKTFTVSEKRRLRRARLTVTATNALIAYVNGHKVGEGVRWNYARCFEIAPFLQAGKNVVAIKATHNGGDRGLIGKVLLEFADGEEEIVTDASWKATNNEVKDWRKPAFDDSAWAMAKDLAELNAAGDDLPKPYPLGPTQTIASPLFRKKFEITKPVKYAQAYICGLGLYELFLNGEKVGDHVLDPAFTRYDKHALYVGYDVTEQLQSGANAVGVMLGNGWFNMHSLAEWDFDKAPWRATPRLLFQLEVEYEDGERVSVVSDASWKSTEGPVRFDCIRNGEYYDAREEKPGWATPVYDDVAWEPVQTVDAPKGALRAQMTLPAKVIQTVQPVAMVEPFPGVYVFDMGQNLTGWAQLRVTGPAGARVTLKYDERITDAGLIDQANNVYLHAGLFQTDTYTLKGEGEEVWSPRFVYHGFQYVQVEGFPGTPTLDSIQAQVVHTDFEQPGHFECANSTLNAIQKNTLWSYVSNFVGYPTDCPHREKNGWTGDAHLAANQAFYNFNPAAAYTKWLGDFADVQKGNGELPGIVPTGGWGFGIGPSWDCAYILLPWYMYVYRGDVRILETHYESMKAYFSYLDSRQEEGVIKYGLPDWVPAKTSTPAAITSTAYYHVDAKLLSRIAAILGKPDEAQSFAQKAEEIKTAFNQKFYNEKTGRYGPGTQTAQATALYQGLVPEAETEKVLKALLRALKRQDDHFDGGILGAKYLPHALTENGYDDLAYTIATHRDFPSWGNFIERNATTLWECWDGKLSRNHIMFGDISAWFYDALLGIRPDPEKPGFKHILIQPHCVEGLEWARGECDTPYGAVQSGWRQDAEKIIFEITVPPNTQATFYLPTDIPEAVLEGDAPVVSAKLQQENGRISMVLGSGSHCYTVRK